MRSNFVLSGFFVGWGHINYGVIATGNHWICYAALCNSPTDALTGPRHYVRTGCTPSVAWSVGTCPHPTVGARQQPDKSKYFFCLSIDYS